MNLTTDVFLINTNVRAVMCNYEPDRPETKIMFKTLDQSIQVGDFVIVPTKTRHGMTASKVVEIDVDVDFDDSTPVCWVISKIDRANYETTIAQEEQAIKVITSAERNKKRNELAESLKALVTAGNGDLAALQITTMNADSGLQNPEKPS